MSECESAAIALERNGLPSFISLRSMRSLRLNIFGGQDVREPVGQCGFPCSEDFRKFPPQATNGSGYWQTRGSADRERRLAAGSFAPALRSASASSVPSLEWRLNL